MSSNKDPQGRKWQLTINNAIEKEITRDTIIEKITQLKSTIYYCMADEIGNEDKTHHTHIYIVFKSAVRFSTIKKLFDTAHIERVNGTSQENRDYIAKDGKWKDSDKADTTIEGSFYEWGEMPAERRHNGTVEDVIIDRIMDGASNSEILYEFGFLRGMRDVEYARQTILSDKYKDVWRTVETTYIWGATGVGKTRSVMDKYGYSNVCAINDYKNPFDNYLGQNVLLFDEFNSILRIQDMHNYLDGFPLTLPARYTNKQACYEKVYIISNIDLKFQYLHEQKANPEVWKAFLRRIKKVIHFISDGTKNIYHTKDYMTDGLPYEVIKTDNHETNDEVNNIYNDDTVEQMEVDANDK